MANNITKPATVFRAGITLASQNDTPVVSYEGGNFEAGFIQNFAVITSGEALGHGSWVDTDFVAAVAMQLASAKKGVVSRYTHPNMSGDALSKGLGRVVYRADGDGKVRGDLHFYKAAHKSPDGNLAEYLMNPSVPLSVLKETLKQKNHTQKLTPPRMIHATWTTYLMFDLASYASSISYLSQPPILTVYSVLMTLSSKPKLSWVSCLG